jgi:hypothetical protein
MHACTSRQKPTFSKPKKEVLVRMPGAFKCTRTDSGFFGRFGFRQSAAAGGLQGQFRLREYRAPNTARSIGSGSSVRATTSSRPVRPSGVVKET